LKVGEEGGGVAAVSSVDDITSDIRQRQPVLGTGHGSGRGERGVGPERVRDEQGNKAGQNEGT